MNSFDVKPKIPKQSENEEKSKSIYNFDLKSARSSSKSKRLRPINTPLLVRDGLRLKLEQRKLKMPANEHF